MRLTDPGRWRLVPNHSLIPINVKTPQIRRSVSIDPMTLLLRLLIRLCFQTHERTSGQGNITALTTYELRVVVW